jgi:hypothetical protein
MTWYQLWIGLKMLNCWEIKCVVGLSISLQITHLFCLLRTQQYGQWGNINVGSSVLYMIQWSRLWIRLKMLNYWEIKCVVGLSKSLQITHLTCSLRTQTIWPVRKYKWGLFSIIYDVMLSALDWGDMLTYWEIKCVVGVPKSLQITHLTCSLRAQIYSQWGNMNGGLFIMQSSSLLIVLR